MPKVKKFDNSLYVALPASMVQGLGIKEGDDLDFLMKTTSSYIVAKKSEIVNLLDGKKEEIVQKAAPSVEWGVDARELELLKKLDTFRYGDRTKDKVDAALNGSEKELLLTLIAKGFVGLYRKDVKDTYKYSISKNVYDKFLYRKGKKEEPVAISVSAPMQIQQPQRPRGIDRSAVKKWSEQSSSNYMEELETNGYVVLKTEADAASASAALEDSIKQGLVVGTRAFDKKFYIGLRGFINKNAPKIIKALDNRSMKAEDLAKEVEMTYDGVKTILCILAESGDITEVRRDVFRLA